MITYLIFKFWCHNCLAEPTEFHCASCLLFSGRQLDKIKMEAQEKGDLGLVAESSRSNQRMMFAPANLTAVGVFNKLKEIGNMSGNSVSWGGFGFFWSAWL